MAFDYFYGKEDSGQYLFYAAFKGVVAIFDYTNDSG